MNQVGYLIEVPLKRSTRQGDPHVEVLVGLHYAFLNLKVRVLCHR